MRIGQFLVGHFLLALCILAGVGAARAQTGPVIVVPGKPGVPVLINGVIVDGAVVYGDWGLARPGHGQIIIEGPVSLPEYYAAPGYFPKSGRKPRYGRHEIEPPPRPRGSTSYHRAWSAGSDPTAPVTQYPPFDPPPVIVAPRGRVR
jgi:hypothetical protein